MRAVVLALPILALVAAPGICPAAATAQGVAVLVPPPGLQPFADLTPAFPSRDATGYTLRYEAPPGPVGPLGGSATLVGTLGRAKYDEELFYDATLRYRNCAPAGPYCQGSGVGDRPTMELFRGLEVGGSRAFATHIVCCNGHYWRLTWYGEADGMTYQMEFDRNIADRYGGGISEGNVAGARALVDIAAQLVPLR
jgi:hypothetical protein